MVDPQIKCGGGTAVCGVYWEKTGAMYSGSPVLPVQMKGITPEIVFLQQMCLYVEKSTTIGYFGVVATYAGMASFLRIARQLIFYSICLALSDRFATVASREFSRVQ